MKIALTAGELRNGWTAESLAAYRQERDETADKVSGNVVTEFKRSRAQPVIESCGRAYSPFSRTRA